MDEITTQVSRLRRELAWEALAAVEHEDCLETVRKPRERFASPGESDLEAKMNESVESALRLAGAMETPATLRRG